ncbi:asparagine synthase-related protein [Aeromonas veronii]|uniref:asparagine synthase-related protein n=1 Tax=Aeromonas veronii TaxID=654 RepID=UPI0038D2E885
MKVFYKVCDTELSFPCIQDFVSTISSSIYTVNNDLLTLCTCSINDRLFLASDSDYIYITDNLRYIVDKIDSALINQPAVDFYQEFGFLLPPYTQYSNIFLVTPYKKFTVSCNSVSFVAVYPQFQASIELKSAIDEFFSKVDNKKLDILVSGGIDSSALLGYLVEKSSINQAYMCKMSSLSSESERANRLCSTKGINFNLIDLDRDLSDVALKFINESGELISDSISIVMIELFQTISRINNGKEIFLVDGQGADSLLNGLPLNKIYHLWSKLHKLRPFLSLFAKFPIYKDKSSSFKRMFYRFSKALKCLSQSEFHNAIVFALSEVDDNKSDVDLLVKRLVEINQHYNDWHFTLRHFYLFDVLPAREMQKYLFAKTFNIKVIAPFLDTELINCVFGAKNETNIVNGVFKYPIAEIAMNYWPGEFESSATSPFQVNYSLGNQNIKTLSIRQLNGIKN